jgi:hypothetical protein
VFKFAISKKNQTIAGTNYKRGFWKIFEVQMMRVRIVKNGEGRVFEYTIDGVSNDTLYSSSMSSFKYSCFVIIVKSEEFSFCDCDFWRCNFTKVGLEIRVFQDLLTHLN